MDETFNFSQADYSRLRDFVAKRLEDAEAMKGLAEAARRGLIALESIREPAKAVDELASRKAKLEQQVGELETQAAGKRRVIGGLEVRQSELEAANAAKESDLAKAEATIQKAGEALSILQQLAKGGNAITLGRELERLLK